MEDMEDGRGAHRFSPDDVRKYIRSRSSVMDPAMGFMNDVVVAGPRVAGLNGERTVEVDLWKLEGEGADRSYSFVSTGIIDADMYRNSRQLERYAFGECFGNVEPGYLINKFIARMETR